MTVRKTNKLKCIVTGRELIATSEYYQRKVDKAGDEDELHRTYICREAKNLIKQGANVDRVRELLNVDISNVGDVSEEIFQSVIREDKTTRVRRINNIVTTSSMINYKTDDDVKNYINTIIHE
jgi:hypothetical protein